MGIALANAVRADGFEWGWLTLAVIGFIGIVRWLNRSPGWWILGLSVVTLSAGALHYSTHRQRLLAWDDLPDREVEVTVKIQRVFGAIEARHGSSFLGRIVEVKDPVTELVGQRIHVQLRAENDPTAVIARNATLRVIGQLTRVERDDTNGFMQYLEASGLNFRLHQARWIATTTEPSLYAAMRDETRRRAGTVLDAGLRDHPDLTGALRAMLLGERHELGTDAKSLFMRSGTMHLFAISGLHIGVIAGALHGLLRALRLSPGTSFVIGSLLLWFYVDLIGQTPSAQRAWLMVTCFHLAQICRAPGNPLAAIAGSALLVLLLNPMQLFSAGFQMSYAVVFALLIHGIPFGEEATRWIRPWRDLPTVSLARWQRLVQATLKTTIFAAALTWTATLVGWISSVAFFGWFTPLAFCANLVLVPLALLVVAGGFLAIGLGLAGLSSCALVFNHAAALVLQAMQTGLALGMGNTGSRPASFIFEFWGPAGMLAVLTAMVVARERIKPSSRWHWGLPTAVALLVLVIGLRFP